jgi:hypothetical protein
MGREVPDDRVAEMTAPDVVYVVRPGEKNEELRYSIRSVIANLPHRKVWISGYCPKWLTGVGHINPGIKPGGHVSAKANLRAACEHPEVSEEFVYMNDDFFVMQPMDQIPVLHRGSLSEVVSRERMASSYQRAMGKTLAILRKQGIAEPLMYDMHAPMTVTKTGMLAALALCSYPMIQERTIYGNIQGIGGEKRRNHKIRRQDNGWQSWPFLSTNDHTFRSLPVGEHIRGAFRSPSPYETEPPPRVREPRAPSPGVVGRRPIRRTAHSTIRRIQVRA